ncbi:MAG: hypothetical protein ACREKN_06620 [Longimicrobiaceae bacterium]
MSGEPALPVRLSDSGRTATWNLALTRARVVELEVRLPDGSLARRGARNSGRARVRAGERIERVYPAAPGG